MGSAENNVMHRMHEMQTSQLPMFEVSVGLSVTRLKSAAACAVYAEFRRHSVQPLSNYFDHLLELAIYTMYSMYLFVSTSVYTVGL